MFGKKRALDEFEASLRSYVQQCNTMDVLPDFSSIVGDTEAIRKHGTGEVIALYEAAIGQLRPQGEVPEHARALLRQRSDMLRELMAQGLRK